MSVTEEYTLNFDFPEQNRSGVMAFKVAEIPVGKVRLNALFIYKPLFDCQDNVNASLLEDGTGIVVTEPTIPSYMVDQHEKMHTLESQESPSELYLAAFHAHTVLVALLRKENKRTTKKSILRFPDNIKCTLEHFNVRDGQKLENKFRLLPDLDAIENETTFNNYVVWILAVENTIQSLDLVGKDSKADISNAINRLRNLKIEKKRA